MKRRLLFLGSVCLLLSPSFSLADAPKHVCEGLLRTLTVVQGLENRCQLPNTYSKNIIAVYHAKNCDNWLDDPTKGEIIRVEVEKLVRVYGTEDINSYRITTMSPQACGMVQDLGVHSVFGDTVKGFDE